MQGVIGNPPKYHYKGVRMQGHKKFRKNLEKLKQTKYSKKNDN